MHGRERAPRRTPGPPPRPRTGSRALFHRWLNDPEVTRHLTVRYPLSHGAERVTRATRPGVDFAAAGFLIETLADSRVIGEVDLVHTSAENRSAELGITIGDKSYWNGGFGTDAIRTVCRFGFQMMNLHRIELQVYPDNDRAIRVYEKVGFAHEGRRRQAIFWYGRYVDVLVMSLLEGQLRDDPPSPGLPS